jgi:hypothetical protein
MNRMRSRSMIASAMSFVRPAARRRIVITRDTPPADRQPAAKPAAEEPASTPATPYSLIGW